MVIESILFFLMLIVILNRMYLLWCNIWNSCKYKCYLKKRIMLYVLYIVFYGFNGFSS